MMIAILFCALLGRREQSEGFKGYVHVCICNRLPTGSCHRESSKSWKSFSSV